MVTPPRRGRVVVSILLFLCLVLFTLCAYFAWRSLTQGSRTLRAGPVLSSVENLNQLTTLRVRTVEYWNATQAKMKVPVLGDVMKESVGFVAVGDADIGVDLKGVEFNLDHQTHKASVVLPQPKVERPRLDLNKCKMVDKSGSWVPWSDRTAELLATVQENAQNDVGTSAATDENLRMARENAERILKNLYGAAGWELDVTWASR